MDVFILHHLLLSQRGQHIELVTNKGVSKFLGDLGQGFYTIILRSSKSIMNCPSFHNPNLKEFYTTFKSGYEFYSTN